MSRTTSIDRRIQKKISRDKTNIGRTARPDNQSIVSQQPGVGPHLVRFAHDERRGAHDVRQGLLFVQHLMRCCVVLRACGARASERVVMLSVKGIVSASGVVHVSIRLRQDCVNCIHLHALCVQRNDALRRVGRLRQRRHHLMNQRTNDRSVCKSGSMKDNEQNIRLSGAGPSIPRHSKTSQTKQATNVQRRSGP